MVRAYLAIAKFILSQKRICLSIPKLQFASLEMHRGGFLLSAISKFIIALGLFPLGGCMTTGPRASEGSIMDVRTRMPLPLASNMCIVAIIY